MLVGKVGFYRSLRCCKGPRICREQFGKHLVHSVQACVQPPCTCSCVWGNIVISDICISKHSVIYLRGTLFHILQVTREHFLKSLGQCRVVLGEQCRKRIVKPLFPHPITALQLAQQISAQRHTFGNHAKFLITHKESIAQFFPNVIYRLICDGNPLFYL